jgi:ABC-type multidrug transport system ATPase subunit
VLVTHHLEEIPETPTHALLIAHGTVVAAGPVHDTFTTDLVSQTVEHPSAVDHSGGDGAPAASAPSAAPEHPQSSATRIGAPSVIATRSAKVSGNTVRGVPPAAQMTS